MTLRLYQFPNSHFCEKVAWALEHKRIEYLPVDLVRMFHFRQMKRLGCAETTVPVLEHQGVVVQGSEQILTWLDEVFPDKRLTPVDPAERARALALERDVGDPLGQHLRRAVLSVALRHPSLGRFVMAQGIKPPMSWGMPLLYPMARAAITRGQARNGVTYESELAAAMALFDALEVELGDGPYLLGGRFTRADLSVAAMLSPLVWPDEHPLPWPAEVTLPPAFAELRARLSARPLWGWALEMYRLHRPVADLLDQ